MAGDCILATRLLSQTPNYPAWTIDRGYAANRRRSAKPEALEIRQMHAPDMLCDIADRIRQRRVPIQVRVG
jgi:hypothetical protein